jgi:hypothetical protein
MHQGMNSSSSLREGDCRPGEQRIGRLLCRGRRLRAADQTDADGEAGPERACQGIGQAQGVHTVYRRKRASC